MHCDKTTKLKIPALNAFDFQIKLTEKERRTHTREIDLHTHSEFELYINLSGDVSFLVANNLYPLSRGDVIIARPGEYHHCVYRSDASHRFFWILFDCSKNSALLDFLKADVGKNYISPQGPLREELIDLCHSLHDGFLSNEERIYAFFRIFAILKQSKNAASDQKSVLFRELHQIVHYIDQHISKELTSGEIAAAFYMSQSTLERKFKDALHVSPSEYIRRKKLVLATELLKAGKSVTEAGAGVGYNDTSYFIELFKRYFGVTPYQYKKANK